MAIRKGVIVVPWGKAPYHDDEAWFATALGRIVKPLVEEYSQTLEWFWFTHIVQKLDESSRETDVSGIPSDFGHDSTYRTIRLCYGIANRHVAEFEERAKTLILDKGCVVTHWPGFSSVEDMLGKAFFGIRLSESQRERRAELVTAFSHAASKLVLDMLTDLPDDEGRYHFEENIEHDFGLRLGYIHHWFCRMAGLPETFIYWDGMNLIPMGALTVGRFPSNTRFTIVA